MEQQLYIWQRKDWPHFTWDKERISSLVTETVKEVYLFLGKVSVTNESLLQPLALDILENEIVSSFSIEEVYLNRSSVRYFLLNRLGIEAEKTYHSDRAAEGAVSILLDAVEDCLSPVTKERLFGWHAQLFPSGLSEGRKIITGNWRNSPVYVVSGRLGKEVVHFEAPPAQRVDEEIDRLLAFVNEDDSVDPFVKAAIAHLWFVTIHPFADGNGRIARTLTELLLARADNQRGRYYSISREILKNRKEYYDVLEYAEKSTMNITRYLEFFLKTVSASVRTSEELLKLVLKKSRLWDSARNLVLNERQVKMINLLLSDFKGNLTAEKWGKITKCSTRTAERDIRDLVNKGILQAEEVHSKKPAYIFAEPE